MIFADKLIKLRKKNGWSQEELANRMNVTRQSVSKWESAQSVPDIEKIITLSELFGVTTDYLLKDDIDEENQSERPKNSPKVKTVCIEQADEFLQLKEKSSVLIAFGTFLCILSPICLLILGAVSEIPKYNLQPNIAGSIGMIVLLVFIASAVAVFIFSSSKTAKYEFLEKENFNTDHDVIEMVNERKKQYKSTYTKNNIIGACICILSLIPLFIGAIIDEDNDLLMTCMLSALFVIAGIGVIFFVRSGIIQSGFGMLLQEGDYSRKNKQHQSVFAAFAAAYWLTATAVYLAYSFASSNWEISWIVWPVAGVLYPAIAALIKIFSNRKK